MPQEMTALVLGAGSSVKFGLPLGSQLKAQLTKALNINFQNGYNQSSGSHEIVNALRADCQGNGINDINPWRHAAVQISTKMPLADSIDEYIERHSADEKKVLCAKLGIALCILRAESKSTLSMKNEDPNSVKIGDSWIARFLNILTRGRSKSDLPSCFDNLFVVNFNYDRCYEQFTYIWLQQMYELSPQESAALCAKIKIFHPYGRLGPLPFEGLSVRVPFGAELTHEKSLLNCASRIRTYAEANDEADEVEWLKPSLVAARRFIFLGFAFHGPNLQICSPPTPSKSMVRCYASVGDEISSHRQEAIENSLRNAISFETAFFPSKGDCEQFWAEFGPVPLS